MKTVFKNSGELCHIWAHQTQAEGRAGNVFFRGGLYYSYGTHYCVGRVFDKDRVALNIAENSPTTNRHRSQARQATRHMIQIFVVNPDCPPSEQLTKNRISRLMDAAVRAKPDGNRPRHIDEALRVAEHYNTFCDWHGLPQRKIELPVLTDEDIATAKKVRREQLAREKAAEKARAAQIALTQAEMIARWRLGEGYSLPHGVATMLRVNHHDQVIETSHSARIPVEDAKRLWPVILRTMRGERDYEVGMPLGQFQLTKIRRDGSIVAGCHDIPFAEIEGIAVQLGLASLSVGEVA